MESTTTFESGDRVAGRYRVIEEIGSGGFSTVYRARERPLGRHVALKVMEFDADGFDHAEVDREQYVERFRREAKLLARLDHPSTVTLHDFGRVESGPFYMALECVDGTPLNRAPRRPVPPRRVVTILEQALGSLEEAHHYGVLHRDIKPSNLILYRRHDAEDRLKLIDFGIAKPLRRSRGETLRPLTGESTILGTPRYLAPEYANDEDPSPASDLYSLGLVAHELLVDRKPVPGEEPMRILEYHLSEDFRIEIPPTPAIPDPLRRVVNRLTTGRLDRRYASAEEVRADLEALPAFDEEYAATAALRQPSMARAPAVETTAHTTRSTQPEQLAPGGETGGSRALATADDPEDRTPPTDPYQPEETAPSESTGETEYVARDAPSSRAGAPAAKERPRPAAGERPRPTAASGLIVADESICSEGTPVAGSQSDEKSGRDRRASVPPGNTARFADDSTKPGGDSSWSPRRLIRRYPWLLVLGATLVATGMVVAALLAG